MNGCWANGRLFDFKFDGNFFSNASVKRIASFWCFNRPHFRNYGIRTSTHHLSDGKGSEFRHTGLWLWSYQVIDISEIQKENLTRNHCQTTPQKTQFGGKCYCNCSEFYRETEICGRWLELIDSIIIVSERRCRSEKARSVTRENWAIARKKKTCWKCSFNLSPSWCTSHSHLWLASAPINHTSSLRSQHTQWRSLTSENFCGIRDRLKQSCKNWKKKFQ